mgnify:CR=1 FL=1
MASKSKTKGNNFERECVNIAKEKGIEIMINDKRLQCKIRKSLPKFLDLDPDKIDGVVIRQDRKPTLILISYIEYLEYIK